MTDAELEARLRALAGLEGAMAENTEAVGRVLARRAQGDRVPLPVESPRRRKPGWLLLVPAVAAAGLVLLTFPLGRPAFPASSTDAPAGVGTADNSFFLPAPLLAQTTTAPAFRVMGPAGLRLKPGRWFYAHESPQASGSGTDTLQVMGIARGDYHGVTAWLMLGGRSAADYRVTWRDTIWLTRDSLRPLGRTAALPGGGTIEEIYGDSQVQTGVTRNGYTTWSVHPAPDVSFDGAGGFVVRWQQFFSTMMGTELSADWKASLQIPFTIIGADHPNYLNLVVVGSEQLAVPAGTFDSWKVGIGTERQSFFFWVSKEKGWIVAQGMSGPNGWYRQVLVRAETD